MSRILSRYWFLFPLLLVAVVVVDRIEQPADVPTETTIDMRQTQSDYYLSDFVTRKFNMDGNIEYTVSGHSLAHYPDDNHSEIIEPKLELHRTDTTWFVQSANGRFDTDPDLFRLQGNVTVKRNSDQVFPVTIKTQSLTIATELNQVSTDETIEIIAPTWRIQAKGLNSAIDDGTLELLSNVTGSYDAPVKK